MRETFYLRDYIPHEGQLAFHYAMTVYDYVALITGIRGGKTVAGAREAVKQAWNVEGKGVYAIVAPTYSMLDRTTWAEFKEAAKPLIAKDNDSKKIITLKNGRKVHGHSADNADRIRNETFVGAWVDEGRECPDFGKLWDILMGRVLSTGGKVFLTTSPNSYDDIHRIFIDEKKKNYGVVRFNTYENTYLKKEAIDSLSERYDPKFAQQELGGEFVLFDGSVYYTFNRKDNAGDLAFKVAQYDKNKPIALCCDFNVDPMAWVVCQKGKSNEGLDEIYVIDEIFLRNSNTVEACGEFKARYPSHSSGLWLYGDATGRARSSNSNVTNWKIIQDELGKYNPVMRVPNSNPNEKDRINAVNGMMCNSKKRRRILINPKCKHTIQDCEQVSYKEGSVQIDKGKSLDLTHPTDALGYFIEKDYSLNKSRIEGLKV